MRAKSNVARHKRRKRILKAAKGFHGARFFTWPGT